MHISLSTVRQFLQNTVVIFQEIEAFEAQIAGAISLVPTTNPTSSPSSVAVASAPVTTNPNPTQAENLDARDDAGIDAALAAA